MKVLTGTKIDLRPFGGIPLIIGIIQALLNNLFFSGVCIGFTLCIILFAILEKKGYVTFAENG